MQGLKEKYSGNLKRTIVSCVRRAMLEAGGIYIYIDLTHKHHSCVHNCQTVEYFVVLCLLVQLARLVA